MFQKSHLIVVSLFGLASSGPLLFKSKKAPPEKINITELLIQNNCFTAIAGLQKEQLLACVKRGSSENLNFYYWNPSPTPTLEQVYSLSYTRDGEGERIALKSSNEVIFLKIKGRDFDLFVSSIWRKELQQVKLSQLCKKIENKTYLLTCQWEREGSARNTKFTWNQFRPSLG